MSSAVAALNGAPWDAAEGVAAPQDDADDLYVDNVGSDASSDAEGRTLFVGGRALSRTASPLRLQQQQQQQPRKPGDADRAVSPKRELLAYLRSIHYTVRDPETAAPVLNSAAALEGLPVASAYSAGLAVADTLSLYDNTVASAQHAYIKARSATAVTVYPLLLSRGIRSLAQLRRISAADVDALRHVLCRDSAGCALLAALLASVQRDSVPPSVDALEVARPSAAGSGCGVRCDVHHAIGVAIDRRPAEHALRWHRDKPALTVVCRECAPETYAADVQPRVDKQPLVCPRPPWHSRVHDARQLADEQAQQRARRVAARPFEPKPVPSTGQLFVPRLTSLKQVLLPLSVLPEETDVGAAATARRVQMRVPRSVEEITAAEDTYDPFRCRAALTFTLDEVAMTAKLLAAVRDAIQTQHYQKARAAAAAAAGGASGSAGSHDAAAALAAASPPPLVDAQTIITAPVLAGALAMLGVAPHAIGVFQSAVSRGRLASVAGGGGAMSSGRASVAGGSNSPRSVSMTRRAGGAGSGVFSAGSGRGLLRGSTANMTLNQTGSLMMSGSPTDTAASGTAGSMRRSRSNFASGRFASNRAAAAAAAAATARRGITVSDLAMWIEQRLDAAKFLRTIFFRFSRSTPWIIFRHELEEAIHGRVMGINLVLQMLDDAETDILPFERFCSEAGHGRLSIAFTELFLADALRFIADAGAGLRGGTRRAGSAASMRRGHSTVSSVPSATGKA